MSLVLACWSLAYPILFLSLSPLSNVLMEFLFPKFLAPKLLHNPVDIIYIAIKFNFLQYIYEINYIWVEPRPPFSSYITIQATW